MSGPLSTPAARVRRVPIASGASRTREKQVPTLVVLVWGALFFNVLAPSGNETLVPIPHSVAQLLAQGSLGVALLLALIANPRMVVRPNVLLALLSVLAVVSLAVSLHNEFLVASTYRALRLCGFVVCLWLLTPWWGRHELPLLRAHRLCLWAILASVFVGMVLSPGKAFSFEGRLSGALWPIPPTQVAHYAAVLVGTSAVLWLCRVIGGRHALLAIAFGVAILVGTHTRTAIVAAIIGLAVASASLFLGHARVRRTSVSSLVVAIVAATLFAPALVQWASRGQTTQQATQLTGRTKVWADVFNTPRPAFDQYFGAGLSNKSFDGMPIDSNWVASYVDQGWFGIVVQAFVLILLLFMAATTVRSPRRAVALFLIVYCVVASSTETGLGDASPYLLDLVVAASLLAPAPRRSSA